MPGATAGRNDPCPCGSGKKYKKCCWDKHGDAKRPAPAEAPPHPHQRAGTLMVPTTLSREEALEFIQRLDRWANGARDDLDAGRDDEVERRCAQLVAEYPDQIDGYEILAQLRERQKRWAGAAELYAKALAVALADKSGFDEEVLGDLKGKAAKARLKAQEALGR